ncbi:MAG: gamma carbonic anhydrase family protein [Myxococcales bacterium]|jgi:carbonic anhydrase/acetyltransferase-like protein (isoleucine patch superfamily)
MALRPYKGRMPVVGADVFIEESAQVIGDVTIGARSSIWFNCVVRGDVNYIRIGEETNVQDLSCLHVLRDRFPLILGDRVTIGHSVTLHGCTIGDQCLVGMGPSSWMARRSAKGALSRPARSSPRARMCLRSAW